MSPSITRSASPTIRRGLLAASALLVAACAEDAPRTGVEGGPGVTIQIAPLSLTGITDACYNLAVTTGGATPATVWTRDGLCADRFGDGQGAITMVGTCDASPGANPHAVDLELVSLHDAAGPLAADAFVNPCPPDAGRCRIAAECVDNGDTPVTFDIVVARRAEQGFFDVAVDLDDIFCSAKLDCAYEDGRPIALLHDPETGQRGATAVVAFACTAGPGEDTTLYLDHVTVACSDGSSFAIDPTAGPGNAGPRGDVLFQTALYRGSEALPGLSKCYWNTALGFDTAYMQANGVTCAVTTRGTAHAGPFPQAPATPAGAVYPFVVWDAVTVGVTDQGALDCGAHPLDGAGSAVHTDYTPTTGRAFSASLTCDSGDVDLAGATRCAGQVTGVDGDVTITPTGDGLVFSVGGVQSDAYALPAGLSAGDCCVSPCCGAP